MKTKKTCFYFLTVAISVSILLSSCKKDKSTTEFSGSSKGIFIVDQGGFMKVNADISYLDLTKNRISNNIFKSTNGRDMGDVAQSMGEANNNYYIIVNNSNVIERVDKTTFKSNGTIQNLKSPRYFLTINQSKAYVTEWGNGDGGKINVINLTTNTVSKTIPADNGAEKLILFNNKVYVANSGGFSNSKKITVINSLTDQVDTTFEVGDNPNSIVVDKNNKLWVLCGGKMKSDWSGFETSGSLVRINPTTNAIEKYLILKMPNMSTNNLIISLTGDMLYYCIDGKVYSQNISSTTTDNTLKLNKNINCIYADNGSNYIYAADAKGFTGNGMVFRYTSNFAPVDSFEVGVAPSFFYPNKN